MEDDTQKLVDDDSHTKCDKLMGPFEHHILIYGLENRTYSRYL